MNIKIWVVVAPFILLAPSPSDAGCTVKIRAKWSGIPSGYKGVIVLKGFRQKAQVKTKGGSWSPIVNSSQREVIFYSDGRFKDAHVWNTSSKGWATINSGNGIWNIQENLRLGCKFRRQYRFLAEVRDSNGRALGGSMIYFPKNGEFTPPDTTVIDFGDLGSFGWRYRP